MSDKLITRDWKALTKQGHPNCPVGYVYVGKGHETINNGRGLGFGKCLKVPDSSDTGTWCGTMSHWHYFCPVNIWEEKTGLNYKDIMNDKKEITLTEVKSKFEEAKKLVGERVKYGMNGSSLNIAKVAGVELAILSVPERKQSGFVQDAFRDNGYSIILEIEPAGWIDIRDVHGVVSQEFTLKLNSQYTATITKGNVHVGCQDFTPEVILELAELVKKAQSE